MTFLEWVIVVVLACILTPLTVFFSIKFAVVAYHSGRRAWKREQHNHRRFE